jgi:hypothetical protein
VIYVIGAATTLITLNGGMTVFGKSTPNTQQYVRFPYICVGSSVSWPGCPATYTDTVIASADVTVPDGHNGVVLFTATTRVQGDSADAGGNVLFHIFIDGVQRGSTGVQQLNYPDAVSTRTVNASYLAAGANALSPGTHHIELKGNASGTFKHLAMTLDLPLLYAPDIPHSGST